MLSKEFECPLYPQDWDAFQQFIENGDLYRNWDQRPLRSTGMWDRNKEALLEPREVFLARIWSYFEGGADIVVTPNLYPYDKLLEEINQGMAMRANGNGVEHVSQYVLWSKVGALQGSEMEDIVMSHFGEVEWIAFAHPPKHQTVPEIWHAHLFTKQVQNGHG